MSPMLKAAALAAAACLIAAAPAAAAVVVTDWTFTTSTNGAENPSGSFELSFDGTAYSLTSFAMTLGGTSFTTANTGIAPAGSNVTIGGTLNGVTVAAVNTNDFFFTFNPVSGAQTTFLYARVVDSGFSVGTATFSRAAGGVPEPAGWALMIAGLGLAGAALRRRRAPAAA